METVNKPKHKLGGMKEINNFRNNKLFKRLLEAQKNKITVKII